MVLSTPRENQVWLLTHRIGKGGQCIVFNHSICYNLFFWHSVSLNISGCLKTHYVDQMGLEPTEICPPLPRIRGVCHHIFCCKFLAQKNTISFSLFSSRVQEAWEDCSSFHVSVCWIYFGGLQWVALLSYSWSSSDWRKLSKIVIKFEVNRGHLNQFEINSQAELVACAFNPRMEEAGGSLCIWGQPCLHSEFQHSQKKKVLQARCSQPSCDW